jgi:hypothetical protein
MAFSVVEQESIEKRLCVVVRLLFSPQGDALIAICRPQCVRGSGRVDVKWTGAETDPQTMGTQQHWTGNAL